MDYTINPTKLTNLKVKWGSSNESVARIDERGEITTYGQGKTTITLSLEMNEDIKVIFILFVKKRGSYIFYTDAAFVEPPYLPQSNYALSAQAIANVCYEGNLSFIEGIEFNNENEFVSAWNNLATNEYLIIDYIFIISHGDFNRIFQTSYDEDYSLSLSISDIDLRLKNLITEGLVLISCNTGDIDQNNIATIFAEKINGAPLIAPDGYLTMSTNICIDGDFGDGKGWYIYIKNNDAIDVIPTYEVQLMHDELLLKLKKIGG